MSNDNTPDSQSSVPEASAETGATFSLPADDPRRTENRGGLEAAYPMTPDVPTLAESMAGEPADDGEDNDDGAVNSAV